MPRQTWQPQVEFVSQHADEFQACVFDNRGHGGSASSNFFTTYGK
jgi:pimeloyl-ACP methyl ester carboxylesterase